MKLTRVSFASDDEYYDVVKTILEYILNGFLYS